MSKFINVAVVAGKQAAILLLVLLALSACGQKGDLYLRGQDQAPAAGQNQDGDEQDEDDRS